MCMTCEVSGMTMLYCLQAHRRSGPPGGGRHQCESLETPGLLANGAGMLGRAVNRRSWAGWSLCPL